MNELELVNIIEKILKIKTETPNIELKTANKGCPEKLYDSLSAFSNQDEGGIIIFGIDEKDDFKIKGVYDANDLQEKITKQCEQMEPPVRPVFTIIDYKDNTIVSLEIPGIPFIERPCYYKGKGKLKGSYIHVGDADEPMTEFEIYEYEAYKYRRKDGLRTIDSSDFFLFDEEKYQKYLSNLKRLRVNLFNNVTDEEINSLMGITNNGKPTVTGILVFSKYPQSYFPQFSITAVKIPGNEMGDTGINNERFEDNVRITGPIDQMLNDSLTFIERNIKKLTIIDQYGKRNDRFEYPLNAVREVIINALVHRDYSRYSEGKTIRIEIYNNRIEIANPGEIYGGYNIKNIGLTRPETRNTELINILELLDITENRYSGIPTIKKEFKNYNLPEPLFISEHGEFKVILKNNLDKLETVFDKVLDFCAIPHTKDEIVEFVGFSKNYVSSKIIKPLVESEQLLLTIPEKPQSPLQKYYRKQD